MKVGSAGIGRSVTQAICKAAGSSGPSFADHLRRPHPPQASGKPRADLARPALPPAGNAELPGERVRFEQHVAAVAGRLRIRPHDLLAIMRFESGLRPDAINPSTHAVGLIQFLPRTAADLLGLPPGTPGRERQAVEAFAAMSRDEQLGYVEAYLEQALGGRDGSSLRDAYMAVLYPSAVGRGDGFVIGRADGPTALDRAVYHQNAALDVNGDGAITAGEAAARVAGLKG